MDRHEWRIRLYSVPSLFRGPNYPIQGSQIKPMRIFTPLVRIPPIVFRQSAVHRGLPGQAAPSISPVNLPNPLFPQIPCIFDPPSLTSLPLTSPLNHILRRGAKTKRGRTRETQAYTHARAMRRERKKCKCEAVGFVPRVCGYDQVVSPP